MLSSLEVFSTDASGKVHRSESLWLSFQHSCTNPQNLLQLLLQKKPNGQIEVLQYLAAPLQALVSLKNETILTMRIYGNTHLNFIKNNY